MTTITLTNYNYKINKKTKTRNIYNVQPQKYFNISMVNSQYGCNIIDGTWYIK